MIRHKKNSPWLRRLLAVLLASACMLFTEGCARMQLYGTVIDAGLHRTPHAERAVRRVEKAQIPGPAAPIPVRIYTPEGTGPFPVLVYFHGGGWVAGSPATHDGVCRFLCSRAACVVVSVDYRLAPKHKFPAAFDDAYAAALWAQENPGRLGGDPNRVAVAGDSAGGNLAAAITLAARDRGRPKLCFQVLAFPGTEFDSLDTNSYRQYGNAGGLTKARVEWYRDQYLRTPEDRHSPYVSPLRAPDHRGLPPALIIVGERDAARDDGLLYAEKLAANSVPARTVTLAGQGHAVVYWAAASERSRQALDAAAAALREAFSGIAPQAGK